MTRTYGRLGKFRLGTMPLGGHLSPTTIPGPVAPGYVMPTIAIQVSFVDPFQTPEWVDITRYVESASTKRGRQHELQRAVAGTMALSVYNQDGRFSTFNTTGPYVNLLSGADSFFQDGSLGTWGNTTNCGVYATPFAGHDQQPALGLLSVASGDMIAKTAIGAAGYAVTVGKTYTAMASFKPSAGNPNRSCRINIAWYNGAALLSTTAGTTVTEAGGTAFVRSTVVGIAPATATTATVSVSVIATGAALELHFVDRVGLFTGDKYGNASTGWAPGGRGLVPTRSVRLLATWQGVTYPVYQGFVDGWIPTYVSTLSLQTINCVDMFSILSLGYLNNPNYYPSVVMVDQPYLYYRCGETSGSVLNDSSGNLQTGIISGGAAFGSAGVLLYDTDSAIDLSNGTTSPSANITTPTFTTTGTTTWTFETWIKTSSTTTQQVYEWPSTVAFGFMQVVTLVMSGGTLSIQHGTQSSNIIGPLGSTVVQSNVVVNDGNWHHVAVTLTTTLGTSGTYALYVDTVSAGSATIDDWKGQLFTGAVYWLASGAGYSGASAWIGQMDEIAVYPSILSSARITANYNAGMVFRQVESSGSRTAAVLNIMGIPTAYQNIATGQSMVQNETSVLTGQQALSYLQTIEKAEQGFGYVDESGVYTFRARNYTWNGTSQGTIASDNNPLHLHAESGQIIPEEGSVDLFNIIPVSARANALLGVVGSVQTAQNTDSAQWYGKRSLTGLTGLPLTSDGAALALSQYLVGRYGLPQARVKMAKVNSLVNNGAQFPQMLGRKLLDRITVNYQPLDGTNSPFVQDSNVEQVSHTITPGQWVTSWALTPAEAQNFFRLDDPVNGVLVAPGGTNSGRLGY